MKRPASRFFGDGWSVGAAARKLMAPLANRFGERIGFRVVVRQVWRLTGGGKKEKPGIFRVFRLDVVPAGAGLRGAGLQLWMARFSTAIAASFTASDMVG
jgi:hypothetical protein